MARVAVIGGGIAGLTAAYRLREQGLDVTLFEATDRTGGMIRSERAEGYLVEHGPNALQASTPLLTELIARLGLEEARLEAAPAARNRYVVRGGRLLPLPGSPPALLTSKLFSLPAKLRLLREPFVRPGPAAGEESVAAFVRRRLGRELLDYAVNPFVAGVYAGDPEQLSLEHGFPKLYRLEREYGSLIRGGLKQARTPRPVPGGRLFSFRDGLQMLPDTLAASLGDRIRLRSPVTGIRRENGHWQITVQEAHSPRLFTAEALVFAAPLHCLAASGLDLGTDLAPLQNVVYPPVSVVALGFRREDVAHGLDGFGLLVPEVETDFQILGTLFSSTLFPGRAPEGHVLLTTFFGGTRHPVRALASTEALQAIVQRDLQILLGLSGPPTFVRHRRWEQAIPQYNLGYGRVKALLDELEARHPGLALAGNYRQGISVGDAMASGDAAARRILDSKHQSA